MIAHQLDMNHNTEKIAVIIIDASAVTRYLLTEIFEQTGDIEVVASTHDTVEALNKIQILRPHVIIFDITASGISGLTFIRKLMELCPTPVLLVSAVKQQQSEAVLKAMELGAVGYVGKQTSQSWNGILNIAEEIVESVRAASTVQFQGSITAGEQPGAGNY